MAAASVPSPRSEKYVPVVSPGLRRLLGFVLPVFGLLTINSLYLLVITVAGELRGESYENYFYLLMFLAHLGFGLLLLVPALVFGGLHLRRAWRHGNRYAVRAGLALYGTVMVLFVSGILLTRFGFFEIDDPRIREPAYWVHLLSPLLLIWLFVLHRLAGPRLRWKRGGWWALAAGLFAVASLGMHMGLQPAGPQLSRPFLPALVQNASGKTIPATHLATDANCGECHADILRQSEGGVHRMSSFNNPAYRFSVEEARQVLLERDGNVRASRLCAACHDPVPLMSGRFDDVDYDPDIDPASRAGITCLACHAITQINSPRGNGDYTLLDPPRYPFAFSDNAFLRLLNRQLIKAKPALHKKTLLKPVHRSAEFCSTCHKVHLPYALNHYRWLRGQNHYDSFLLSGVSGHRVDSFYYPPTATQRCAQCHMPLTTSDDPAARDFDGRGGRKVHHHRFAAANTAVPLMLGRPAAENEARRDMLSKAARVDIFGIREHAAVDGRLHAPLRPQQPVLQPGRSYLIETVVRTLGVGHALTQGTADSNELWLDVTLRSGERVIGRSGRLDDTGDVDPWAYFLNAYLLDRDGERIERRNAQDIFVALYDHQIPPGAASVVHYAVTIPPDIVDPVTIEVKLQYRKFDTRFLRHVKKADFERNDLPVSTLAVDRITLPVSEGRSLPPQVVSIATWERWNDYGIALLREGNSGSNKGELRAAALAFEQVERLGRADGPLNLARVYYKEGRVDEAAAALRRAGNFDPAAPPWTVAWFSALVEREQGQLDQAITHLTALAETRFPSARDRGFDFSRDYNLLNELGRTLFERARRERGASRRVARQALLQQARVRFDQVLALDPENATAHYNLALVYAELGDPQQAAAHRQLHARYRRDDQAIEQAVARHRRSHPAANHAAEAVAIYALQPGAPSTGVTGAVTGTMKLAVD